MGWGALTGLGQGLQQVGLAKMQEAADERKSKFLDKLEQSKEQRAADRVKNTPKSREVFSKDGAYMVNVLGGEGNLLRVEPAREDEVTKYQQGITKFDLDKKATEANIEQSRAATEGSKVETELKGKKLADYAIDSELDREKTRAEIDTERAQGMSYRANAGKTAAEASSGTKINDYVNSYVESEPSVSVNWIDNGKLTENQVKEALTRVLTEFVDRGQKPTPADIDAGLASYYKIVQANPEKYGKKKKEEDGSKTTKVSLRNG